MTDFLNSVRKFLKVPDGVQVPKELRTENVQLRFLGAQTKSMPKDPLEAALTVQWLSLAGRVRNSGDAGAKQVALELLNNELLLRVFATGFSLTLADAVLFLSVGPHLASLSDSARAELPNVCRWYAHVAHVSGSAPAFETPAAPTLTECQSSAKPIPLPTVAAAPAAAAGGGQGKQAKQQQQKPKGKKKDKQKGGNNGGGGKKAAAAAANAVEPIAEIDIRVGHIVKAWEHPDSDKLWCESVDCGEEKPRQILSGLRHNFTEEQMLRRVLVVCNLKAAKLGGIPSHGMVLCASNDDHTQVEFLEPPKGAKTGERVTFEGLANAEPASGTRVNKKKIFAKAAEALQTTAECVAAHAGRKMMTSAGPVTVASLKERPIK